MTPRNIRGEGRELKIFLHPPTRHDDTGNQKSQKFSLLGPFSMHGIISSNRGEATREEEKGGKSDRPSPNDT